MDKSFLSKNGVKNVSIACHGAIEKVQKSNDKEDVKVLLSPLNKFGVDVLFGNFNLTPSDLYIYIDSISEVSYIHSHLADIKEDKILKFSINNVRYVNISPISLCVVKINSIKIYTSIVGHLSVLIEEISIEEKVFNLLRNIIFQGIIAGFFIFLALYFLIFFFRKYKPICIPSL